MGLQYVASDGKELKFANWEEQANEVSKMDANKFLATYIRDKNSYLETK